MQLPTAKEINPHGKLYLDGRVACKHFLGKNLDEAEALFRENSIYYQGDLMWMGPVAFRYYVMAAIQYIRSAAAAGDSDMINCFAGFLEFRIGQEPEELAPIADRLASACNYIVEQYNRFDLRPEIYGDVRARLVVLGLAFSRLRLETPEP